MKNIGNIIKTLQNIMRKDPGVSGDAQRIEQLGWMICKRRSKSAAGGGLIVRHRGYTYPLQNLQSNIFLAHQS